MCVRECVCECVSVCVFRCVLTRLAITVDDTHRGNDNEIGVLCCGRAISICMPPTACVMLLAAAIIVGITAITIIIAIVHFLLERAHCPLEHKHRNK